MGRIAPGWTAHRMNICSRPNQQHEYSYLSILSHQLSRLCVQCLIPACSAMLLTSLKRIKDFIKPIQTNYFSFDNSMSRIFYLTLLTLLTSLKRIKDYGIYQHDDAYQNQGSRKLDHLFCGKGSSVNYTNLRLLGYMLQSRESSWRFPSTLQTIMNLSLINLKRSSAEIFKTK